MQISHGIGCIRISWGTIKINGVKGTGPLDPINVRRGSKDVTCYTSIMLKSTALGLRGGVANPCDSGQSLPFYF